MLKCFVPTVALLKFKLEKDNDMNKIILITGASSGFGALTARALAKAGHTALFWRQFMDLSHNTVLVTGGGSGIGLVIAKRFLDAGSQVVVCGRRADKLAKARAAHPGLETRVADVADPIDREKLIAWMIAEYPDFNVLVNNAGIQRRERFAADTADWSSRQKEIAINLEAPVHLASLVLQYCSDRL
jgi:short-subunit dehydrogenase involved in D-alanine esterification of teichoic acids